MQACLAEMRIVRDDVRSLSEQIRSGIRHAVAMRRLAPGEGLPSLREAGEAWGVSLHTARKAYLALEEEGLLEIRGTRGAFVKASGTARSPASLEARILELLADAEREYGLERSDVAELVRELAGPSPEVPPVWVMECTPTLRRLLARHIADRLGVEARPWDVAEAGSVPEGHVVSTYYHFSDLRRELAGRGRDLTFVAFRFDPAAIVPALARGVKKVMVCVQDPSLAEVIADEVRDALPPEIEVEGTSVDPPEKALEEGGPPVLFTPPMWDRLEQRHRERSTAVRLEVRIEEDDLLRLERALRGRAATPHSVRGWHDVERGHPATSPGRP